MILPRLAASLFLAVVLAACAPAGVKPTTSNHVTRPAVPQAAAGDIPAPLSRSLALPAPKAQAKPETYSVVVNNVRVQELLFALARDAKVNVDIHPGVTGTVTLNALDQTLPQLLARIARQVDMRFELDGPNLVVMPDTPYLRNYKIDYVNLSRDSTSSMTVSAQIATAGSAARSGSNSSSAGGNTNSGSLSRIENSSKNRFWDSLVQNIKDLLRETDKVFPEGKGETVVQQVNKQALGPALSAAVTPEAANALLNASETTTVRTTSFREAASVIANVETGVLSVRATSRQHEKVQEFLDRVMSSAKRQVLIEATIAEVELSENYQQGIQWEVLRLFGSGLRIEQRSIGGIANANSQLLEIGYTSSRGNFDGAVKLLESFGNVRVLSSPKLSVLNNQTAVMKVVDDNIYFTYEKEEKEATSNSAARTTITSTIHSVPVGLVLTVTPLVGEDDSVTLNIRPSLSRVIAQKEDPSLEVILGSGGTLKNTIPIVRAREFDSVMRVTNGNIAVMGGLMEDLLDLKTDAVPAAASIPLIGGLFQNRNDTKKKTELVIFIRPTIIRDPSLTGDFAAQRGALPDDRFFDERIGPPLVPPLPGSTGSGQP